MMEQNKVRKFPLPKSGPNTFEGVVSNLKLKFHLGFIALFAFYMGLWGMVVSFFSFDGGVRFGLVFSIITLLLGWWIIVQYKNRLKISQNGVCFNISNQGFKYSMVDEFSGNLMHKEVFWSDVIKGYHPFDEDDVYLEDSSGEYKRVFLCFYISREVGSEEKVSIPVSEINRYKDKVNLVAALLCNLATAPLPKLSFSEEVFYYFNVNPVDFSRKRKGVKRVLARFCLWGVLLAMCLSMIAGSIEIIMYFDIYGVYRAALILGVIVVMLFLSILVLLMSKRVPFLKLANGDYSVVIYEDNQAGICSDSNPPEGFSPDCDFKSIAKHRSRSARLSRSGHRTRSSKKKKRM